jgi:hypothetical protein
LIVPSIVESSPVLVGVKEGRLTPTAGPAFIKDAAGDLGPGKVSGQARGAGQPD